MCLFVTDFNISWFHCESLLMWKGQLNVKSVDTKKDGQSLACFRSMLSTVSRFGASRFNSRPCRFAAFSSRVFTKTYRQLHQGGVPLTNQKSVQGCRPNRPMRTLTARISTKGKLQACFVHIMTYWVMTFCLRSMTFWYLDQKMSGTIFGKLLILAPIGALCYNTL